MPTFFGTLTGFTIPYTNISSDTLTPNSGSDYLNDYEYNPATGYSQNVTSLYNNGIVETITGFTYLGIGGSRLSELKKYGSTGNTLSNYTPLPQTGTTKLGGVDKNYTGYTFSITGSIKSTQLIYWDIEGGYTMITGNTTGFTKEEVINYTLTRNEHFLGFVEQPTVYSDIFVERGKLGVMERNFRLSEIDSMGELSIYGNGYFKVRKQ
jgi:hypothetical protein